MDSIDMTRFLDLKVWPKVWTKVWPKVWTGLFFDIIKISFP